MTLYSFAWFQLVGLLICGYCVQGLVRPLFETEKKELDADKDFSALACHAQNQKMKNAQILMTEAIALGPKAVASVSKAFDSLLVWDPTAIFSNVETAASRPATANLALKTAVMGFKAMASGPKTAKTQNSYFRSPHYHFRFRKAEKQR